MKNGHPFIICLKNNIRNPKKNDTDPATALALQGMHDALQKIFTGKTLTSNNSEKNQFAINNYGMSISDSKVIFDQYVNGTKGTRCF
jgi:hypothetical protein